MLEPIYRSGEDLSSRTRVAWADRCRVRRWPGTGGPMSAVAEAAGLAHARGHSCGMWRGAILRELSYPCAARLMPFWPHTIPDDEPQCSRTREASAMRSYWMRSSVTQSVSRGRHMLQAPYGRDADPGRRRAPLTARYWVLRLAVDVGNLWGRGRCGWLMLA